jgi:intermediate peptidase
VFHHEVEGELGTMFFDLHLRDGKVLHAAHFVIQCGRIRNNEDNEGGGVGSRDDGMRGKGDHQLLIIAPVCNLSPSQSSASGCSPTPRWRRSITKSVASCTRCFRAHPSSTCRAPAPRWTPSRLPVTCSTRSCGTPGSFLSRILAQHYVTGRRHLERSHIDFRGVEVQTQIVRSKFDQALFEPNPCALSLGGCTSTEMFERLHRKADVPFASGTHWHSRFGHLVTYGVG